jgi:hypothetical protein
MTSAVERKSLNYIRMDLATQFTLPHWTTGVRSPAEARNFFSSFCFQTSSEAHPAFCPRGTGVPFSGGRARPGRDADHSPPSSVVRN